MRQPWSGAVESASSGNVANAQAQATFAADAKQLWYLTGLEITYSGATAAGVVVATITGLLGGTIDYVVPVPVGVSVGAVPISVQFGHPLAGAAPNTAIVATVPALGSGNTNCVLNIHGFKVSTNGNLLD